MTNQLKKQQKACPLVQKCKLAKLLDCFDANPHCFYKLTAYRGTLHTVIDQNRDFFNDKEKENQKISHFNHCEEFDQSKKKIGLFANIIRNMGTKKQSEAIGTKAKTRQKNKGYTFYFPQFEQRARNNHENHVSRPTTAQTQQNNFDCIQIAENVMAERKENCNHQNESKYSKKEQQLDLNFSFDQISKHIASIKQAPQSQEQRQQDTIIHKYLNEHSYAEAYTEKVQAQKFKQAKLIEKPSTAINERPKMQPINFAKLSKQYKISGPQVAAPPIRQSLSKAVVKQSSALLGTKKVESRIISNNYVPNDPHSIRIDFDLDINFI